MFYGRIDEFIEIMGKYFGGESNRNPLCALLE